MLCRPTALALFAACLCMTGCPQDSPDDNAFGSDSAATDSAGTGGATNDSATNDSATNGGTGADAGSVAKDAGNSASDAGSTAKDAGNTGTDAGTGAKPTPSWAKLLSLGTQHACALLDGGKVACWGRNESNQVGNGVSGSGAAERTPYVLSALTGVVHVAAGGNHSCAAKSSGELVCWGLNSDGQHGLASTSGYNKALAPSYIGKKDVVRVGVGYSSSFGMRKEGGLWAMGRNLHHELASNQLGLSNVGIPGGLDAGGNPVFPKDNPAVLVDGGIAHVCALAKGGQLWCWGGSEFSQTGSGTSGANQKLKNPYKVASNVKRFSAGNQHTCLVTTTGKARCFGRNNYRQIGVASGDSFVPKPSDVLQVGEVIDICAGLEHSCALDKAGKTWCWGHNQHGAVGKASNVDKLAMPTELPMPKAVAIRCGGHHTCAIGFDGKVRCWGRNDLGQLGNDDNKDSHTPVEVAQP